MLTRKKICLLTVGFALVVRAGFAALVAGSLFRFYHCVPGLDMQTLLRFSEWGGGGPDATPFFSPHRIMLFLNWLAHGGRHGVAVIFAVQSLLGALGCAAVADLTLALTGRRRGALAAGCAAALYLPLLIYEFSVLQDSFAVNLTLFAVWGTVRAARRRFAPVPAVGAAALWSFALAGRPTALLCAAGFGLWAAAGPARRHRLRRMLLPTGILLILLAAYSAFNCRHGWDFSPFYRVLEYTRVSNAAPGEAPASLRQVAFNAARRAPALWAAGEIPENHNLYFWCEKLPVLHALPSPGLLLPAAAAGLAVLLVSGNWKRRSFMVIAIPLLTLALPLCARTVIGRYRLMLTPYFILAAAAGWHAFRRLPVRRRALAALTGGAAAALSAHATVPPPRVRAEDHHAWALAQKAVPGATSEQVLNAFDAYWRAAAFRSEKAFRATVDQALAHGDLRRASRIVAEAERNGISPALTDYFRCWIFALAGRPEKVAQLASRVDPARLPAELRPRFLHLRDDTRKLLQKRRDGGIL